MIKKTYEPDGTVAREAPVWLLNAFSSYALPPQTENDDPSSNDELLDPEDHPLGFV